MMIKIGYSLIDQSNNEISFNRSLPWSPAPPGKPRGRIATFTEVGQTADGYTVVERWQTEQTNNHQVSSGTNIYYDAQNNRTVVDKQWTYPSDLATAKATRIEEVKEEANNRISSLYPTWKQLNMIARQGELFRIEAGYMRNPQGQIQSQRGLNQDEIAELSYIANAWETVKAIREHTAVLEAEINALTTVEDVYNWTATGWPE